MKTRWPWALPWAHRSEKRRMFIGGLGEWRLGAAILVIAAYAAAVPPPVHPWNRLRQATRCVPLRGKAPKAT
ncbi:hypothetical protein D3C87_1980090 [compost metagenome]